MCGRYSNRKTKQEIAERLRAEQVTHEPYVANYNIAPSTFQPVVRTEKDSGKRELVMLRWGLIPFFAKSPQAFKGFSTINARAEDIQSKATWRTPFKKRRCLVPATGFYEWLTLDPKAKKPTKQPYNIEMQDQGLFAFGGLWDAWHSEDKPGEWLQSFTIIVTTPNDLMVPFHDRMPVILHERDWAKWLDRDFGSDPAEAEELKAMLRPYESDAMTAYACNPAVGNVKNNGPKMLDHA